MASQTMNYRIVVGVDISASANAALKWAAAEAKLREAELVVIHALDPALAVRAPYAPVAADDQIAREQAVHEVDKMVNCVLAVARPPRVHRRYVVDLPARALASACIDADMLVVGSDIRAGSPRVGATPRACLQSVSCPTIVVPAPEQ